MVTVITRIVGAVLALAGLALLVLGLWFATRLGGAGTAQFTLRPAAGVPVVLPPEVLNRVDAGVVVTGTPSRGGRVWIAKANPSDATALLGRSRHLEVTGVALRDGLLVTTERAGSVAPTLSGADVWRQQDDGTGPVSLTVDQAQAPESVVVAAVEGSVASVTLTVSDKQWFVEAVVAALVGLFLLIAGLIAAWPRRRRTVTPVTPARAQVADDAADRAVADHALAAHEESR